MGGKALAKHFTLRIGNWERILLGDDPFPKRSDVAELFLGGELVKSRRRDQHRLCHKSSIASGSALATRQAMRTAELRVRLTAWRSATSARNNFIGCYHLTDGRNHLTRTRAAALVSCNALLDSNVAYFRFHVPDVLFSATKFLPLVVLKMRQSVVPLR